MVAELDSEIKQVWAAAANALQAAGAKIQVELKKNVPNSIKSNI